MFDIKNQFYLDRKGVQDIFEIIDNDFSTKEELTTAVNSLTDGLKNKVDKISGKSLSTNDYIDTDKTKLQDLPFVEVLESEDEYNALEEKADNTLYLIKGNPGIFTTQDDLDILENSISTDIDERLGNYQLKSNMVNYVDSREFTLLTERVVALENKIS